MTALPSGIAVALETAINRVLQLDPDTLHRLQNMQGRVIALELSGIDVSLFFIPCPQGVNVFSRFEGEADTVLRGTPLAMARLGLVEHAGDVLFAGDVDIRGDVELGQQFRDILQRMDIDWEEHLSHLTGDMVAHKLGDLTRTAMAWSRQTLETLIVDTGEYLREESRDVPAADEVEEYLKAVDTLRADMDRLEARVKRVQRQLACKAGRDT